MVKRVLLVLNQTAGTGHSGPDAGRLQATLARILGSGVDLHTKLVTDHQQAKACAQHFLSASDTPGAIIAGGGSGTLRAVIEGVCAGCTPGGLPGRERVRLAALRMGSGNVVAKYFGVPLDAAEAVQSIAANLLADRVAPLRVINCLVGKAGGGVEILFAATMCGLGQFGRSSGDLARWRYRLARLRRAATCLLKIETLNDLEYRLAVLIRSFRCVVRPGVCELIEVQAQGKKQSLRLLAGVALNVPIRSLPPEWQACPENAALSLYVIPFPGRFKSLWMALAPGRLVRCARKITVGPGESAEMRFTEPESVEFFLDEDPETAYQLMTIRLAGTLAFVPGLGYAGPGSWSPS